MDRDHPLHDEATSSEPRVFHLEASLEGAPEIVAGLTASGWSALSSGTRFGGSWAATIFWADPSGTPPCQFEATLTWALTVRDEPACATGGVHQVVVRPHDVAECAPPEPVEGAMIERRGRVAGQRVNADFRTSWLPSATCIGAFGNERNGVISLTVSRGSRPPVDPPTRHPGMDTAELRDWESSADQQP